MRWKLEDMEQIIGMEEYVDTLLYPVCVSGREWDQGWIKAQFWLERVCGYAERQLTGRIFLFNPLCIARKQEIDEEISYSFVSQNTQSFSRRFPYQLVVTNDDTMSIELTKRGIKTYVISEPPEEKADTKLFLEKALSESNRIVAHCVALWQSQ